VLQPGAPSTTRVILTVTLEKNAVNGAEKSTAGLGSPGIRVLLRYWSKFRSKSQLCCCAVAIKFDTRTSTANAN